jgi:hypothetical protein
MDGTVRGQTRRIEMGETDAISGARSRVDLSGDGRGGAARKAQIAQDHHVEHVPKRRRLRRK